MTNNILYVFGEDGEYQYLNGGVGNGITVQQSNLPMQNFYNANHARCAVCVGVGASTTTNVYAEYQFDAELSRMWFSVSIAVASGTGSFNYNLLNIIDQYGIPRIQVVNTTPNSPAGPYNVYKSDSFGSMTLLFTTTMGFADSNITPSNVVKFGFTINYSPTGFISLAMNAKAMGGYSGDITTDGVTTLGGLQLGAGCSGGAYWSECIVAQGPINNLSLITCAAGGPGTTDQWTGAYTNVNEITYNGNNYDTTETSGNVQLYDMSAPSLGTNIVLAVVTNIIVGGAPSGSGITSNLGQLALAQNIDGTQVISDPGGFGTQSFIQTTNPLTGLSWSQTDLNSLQSGYQGI
jgi:hypothetical protein